MTVSGVLAPRPGAVVARGVGALCLAGASALAAVLVLRPEIVPEGTGRGAWALVVVLAAVGAVSTAGARRRARPGRFVATAAASVAGLLLGYVVLVAPTGLPPGRAQLARPLAPWAVDGGTELPQAPAPAGADGGRQVRTPVIGVSTPTLADYDTLVQATGTHPEVLDVFAPWSGGRPLDPAVADAVAARGAELEITWEPWDPQRSDTRQPNYTLATIIAGRHDAYIDLFAASVKAVGRPVIIRLMHEMNGDWYPWGRGVEGNTPQQYVQAWRHVVDRFRALGVTDVSWLWAPNAVYPGAAPLAPLYPGDAYVDEVGVSNYNWGDQEHDGFATRWATFGELFDPSIAELRQLTNRPLWIAEVASTDEGGSKAAWITAMFAALQQRPDIAGLVWFDREDTDARADWRIEGEPPAVAAWRAGMADRAVVPDVGGPGATAR